MGKEITLTVVGIHYRLTAPTVRKLIADLPIKVELRREPENMHDENAIAVWAMEKPYRNTQIGYLKREVAADLAGAMDEGDFNPREAWLTKIDDEHKAEGGNKYEGQLIVKL